MVELVASDLICKKADFGSASGYLVLAALSEDPIVKQYLNGSAPNDYMIKVMAEMTYPGDLVLDLGCHVGTFSIGAALLGRRVLSVDANPLHAELVRRSAGVNGLSNISVVNRAVSTRPGSIPFIANGLFSAIDFSGNAFGTLEVEAMRLDAIIAAYAGEARIRFLKMDIEGAEYEALLSGARVMREHGPAIWWESNGPTLELAGRTIQDVRTLLEENGYKTFRAEGEKWVYAPPQQIQPEAWLDVISLSADDQKCWADRIEWDWPPEAIEARCTEWLAYRHRHTLRHLISEIDRHGKSGTLGSISENAQNLLQGLP